MLILFRAKLSLRNNAVSSKCSKMERMEVNYFLWTELLNQEGFSCISSAASFKLLSSSASHSRASCLRGSIKSAVPEKNNSQDLTLAPDIL